MQPEPLRVTVVAHDVGGVGGMERVLEEMIVGLLGDGHRITVISRTCRLAARERLRWVRVPGPARPFILGYPWFCALASLLVRRTRSDLVHTTGAIVLNRADVCTVHLCHHAVAARRGPRRASRGGALHRLNAAIAEWLSLAAERAIYRPRRTGLLVAVSDGAAAQLRRHFPRMARRITVVPNGVDGDRFRPATRPKAELRSELGVPPDGALAVFVGSEWERKGLASAIEAVARTDGWRLIVAGSGDTARYARLASTCGVSARIHFHGVTADVLTCFQAADALLLPTTYETFSLVTYEAAACGLPLLAGDVDGIRDILIDGVNGWFIDGDAAKTACLLGRLGCSGTASEMGAAARRSSARFDWGQSVRGYESCYLAARGALGKRTKNDAAH